jgi:hypothetical protein
MGGALGLQLVNNIAQNRMLANIPARAQLFLEVTWNSNIDVIVNENSEILEISEFFFMFYNSL